MPFPARAECMRQSGLQEADWLSDVLSGAGAAGFMAGRLEDGLFRKRETASGIVASRCSLSTMLEMYRPLLAG